MKELNPDMTVREVRHIVEDAESDVWDEGFHGMCRIDGECRFDTGKITLREISDGHFAVFSMIGGNEGIYLHVESARNDGKRNEILSAKSLMCPDSEHWDKCWQSAGRISFALHRMWW